MNCFINENNNGTFINLTDVTTNIINQLETYIKYVEKQHNELSVIENEKQELEKNFFN